MATKDLGSATLGASLTKENTILAEVGGSIRRIPVSTFIQDFKGIAVVSYADYTNMGSKDAGTLYAVTKDGSCDIYLGSIRITNNIG